MTSRDDVIMFRDKDENPLKKNLHAVSRSERSNAAAVEVFTLSIILGIVSPVTKTISKTTLLINSAAPGYIFYLIPANPILLSE